MTLKKVQLVMLPTNEKAKGQIIKSNNYNTSIGNPNGLIAIILDPEKDDKHSQWTGQHLYFLSDEEIKEGDYAVDGSQVFGPYQKGDVFIDFKGKIIATTDSSLSI